MENIHAQIVLQSTQSLIKSKFQKLILNNKGI